MTDTVSSPENTPQTKRPPINWPGALVLLLTPIAALILVPTYLWSHHVGMATWVVFALFLAWNGLGITAGYHRLWAHRTYEATWIVRFFLMIGGTMAIQNSVLFWASGHRTHHQHVDHVDRDPYSAKRGFWYSHIGWMLRNYPSGEANYKNAPDLLNDRMVMFQHNYYIPLVLLTNIALPALVGWAIGDVWGVLMLGGLLRLVISHHVTFFINSLAHMFGSQPYTDENTARDNPWLAFVTWGEGYHNFHHIFQYDYRNGVKWWQFDPTKWLILGLSKIKLTYNLKRIPTLTILHAEVAMKFKRAEANISTAVSSYGHDMQHDIEAVRHHFKHEYEAFSHTIHEWTKLKEQAFLLKKAEVSQKIHDVDMRLKADLHLIEQRFHDHAERLESALRGIRFVKSAG
ncbi:acyl-CoA desaturase [Aquirhabdus sp.]|uniref:acyl-CoA desaturase n=1 Tax=Aquirhabdus sp. TaxID=2824160 RepID=UPI00396C9B6E